MDDPTPPTAARTALTRVLRWVGLPRRPVAAAQREQIAEALYDRARVGGPATRNFAVLSVLSSAIAAMGLLLDSAPAVIGAMLLGPFIVPLLAIAGSLVNGWGVRLARAAAMVALGVVMSCAAAFVVGLVFAPELEREVLPAQLLALTRPGLLDLGIALAAGLAAGYATMRTEAAGALSGVAVSVTLEPPLAAIGLFLASGDAHDVRQSVLAFATNFGALVLGATVALTWWGFGERVRPRATARWALLVWVGLMAGVTVPLALYSREVIRNARFERDVTRTVQTWDPSVAVVDVDAELRSTRAEVQLSITGPRAPEPAWRLAELLSDEHGVRVEVTVTFSLTAEDRAVATD